MKLVILGDLHLVAPNDPFLGALPDRRHFADGWPSFHKIITKVKEESPDLVVSLGDLVDWYTDESRDFALELLSQLPVPWVASAGNHDLSMYEWDEDDGNPILYAQGEKFDTADLGWKARGIDLHNQVIEDGRTKLLLMSAPFSDVLPGTREWLNTELSGQSTNYIFTHVPLDIPETREFILGKQPWRKMDKYVQSKAPWVYEDCLKGKVKEVFSAHLHFPGTVTADTTTMRMLALSTIATKDKYEGMGYVAVYDTERPNSFEIRMLER